jgi:hypothetical protein
MCRSGFELYWRITRPETRLAVLIGLRHVRADREELAIDTVYAWNRCKVSKSESHRLYDLPKVDPSYQARYILIT